MDAICVLSVHFLVTEKDAEIFLCKLPHFAFIILIFQVEKLMYQSGHGSAFEIKTNFLFFVILHFFLKKAPSFGKNEDYTLICASSSKGLPIFFLKRENPNLNILDSSFLNFFPLNYPVKEFLEQRFSQSLRNR